MKTGFNNMKADRTRVLELVWKLVLKLATKLVLVWKRVLKPVWERVSKLNCEIRIYGQA